MPLDNTKTITAVTYNGNDWPVGGGGGGETCELELITTSSYVYVVDSQGVLHFYDDSGYDDTLTVNQGALILVFPLRDFDIVTDGIEVLVDPSTQAYDLFYLLKVVSSNASLWA